MPEVWKEDEIMLYIGAAILIYLIGIPVAFVLFTLAAFLAGEEVTVEDLSYSGTSWVMVLFALYILFKVFLKSLINFIVLIAKVTKIDTLLFSLEKNLEENGDKVVFDFRRISKDD